MHLCAIRPSIHPTGHLFLVEIHFLSFRKKEQAETSPITPITNDETNCKPSISFAAPSSSSLSYFLFLIFGKESCVVDSLFFLLLVSVRIVVSITALVFGSCLLSTVPLPSFVVILIIISKDVRDHWNFVGRRKCVCEFLKKFWFCGRSKRKGRAFLP